jgi:integrase/recombinase XerD
MRANAEKPDARPHMLVTLLLQTGIKKGECVALTPADVDRSDPSSPFLWVRYTNPRLRYKERKINLDREWLPVYEEYILQRRPVETIFDCTARNLEYVLRDVAQAAGVPRKKVSFEALRWTCAVSDFRAQMDHERLRQKLGLSRISWRETSSRLQQLVEGLGE